MKNVVLLGAAAKVGKYTYEFLKDNHDLNLTLVMRNPDKVYDQERTIIGDALNLDNMIKATKDADVVISTLGPRPMAEMAENIIKAMDHNHVKRLIWTASLGIYGMAENIDADLGNPADATTYLGDQRQAADLLFDSDLEVTIVRPNWLTMADVVEDLQIDDRHTPTAKGQISRKSVGHFLANLAVDDQQFINESPAITAKN